MLSRRCRAAGKSGLELETPVSPLSSNWKTRDLESPIVSAIGCSNRSLPQGSTTDWDLGSRSRVRLFATTAATYGLNQPPAPVSSSVFLCTKPTVSLDGRHFRRTPVKPHD